MSRFLQNGGGRIRKNSQLRGQHSVSRAVRSVNSADKCFVNNKRRQEKEDEKLEKYRKLWEDLHTKKDATEEWFQEWICRVKKLQCDCRKKLSELLEANPPRYDDWFAWTVEVHNSVNRKLKKAIVTIEQARQIWNNEAKPSVTSEKE